MEIKKSILNKFIEKYHLFGKIQKVKLQIEEDTLSCNFVSDDKSIIGKVSLSDFEAEDLEIGVYDTTQLIKLINILDEDIEVSFLKNANDFYNVMNLKDKVDKDINFTLCDLESVPKSVTIKALPNFEIEIPVDSSFIDSYNQAKGALDTPGVYVTKNKKGNIEFIISNNLDVNSISIKIETKCNIPVDFNTLKFDSSHLKDILNANKKAKSGRIRISSRGLMIVDFIEGNYESEYFLIGKNEV